MNYEMRRGFWIGMNLPGGKIVLKEYDKIHKWSKII